MQLTRSRISARLTARLSVPISILTFYQTIDANFLMVSDAPAAGIDSSADESEAENIST